MRLPVLPSQSAVAREDLVRYFHRARLQWRRGLAEEIDCPVGTALADAGHPEFNIIMEAATRSGHDAADAIAQAQAAFADYGGCRQWVLNPAARLERTGPLGKALESAGYQTVRRNIFHLHQPTETPAQDPDSSLRNLKILPARAALAHWDELARQIAGEMKLPSLHEASLRHLDDAHYDALIALADSRPVARIGVLAVGQIGLIEQWHVLPSHRRRGVGRLMLARAIEIAVRSRFQHLFSIAGPDDQAVANRFMDFGFSAVGQMVTYQRAGVASAAA